ncbi:MAG: hypothetical protein M3Y56_02230 [Armatimonadota bacterium]|nr:hypothetical protein [Armatimonadota bacterium]
MALSYPWRRQEAQRLQQRLALPIVKLVPYGCIALLPNGQPCGKPAGVLDKDHGGLICWSCFRSLELPAEEQARRYVIPFEDGPPLEDERERYEDL